ncbi:MAG TPA: DUF3043 domain-containing protein [Mycobacterium sp.]|nr:DUF3043 domain-containing protein [Mycobacterium sp.]
MKLLGRGKDSAAVGSSDDPGHLESGGAGVDATDPAASPGSRSTAPKGRPTPKRSAAARRRGPVAPAPMTSAEARARRKTLAGPKLSRDEKRAEKARRRERMTERRERMLSGDEAYLLDRDRGPVRRYVRDVVDARRNLLGLFMPAALGLLFVMMAIPIPAMQPVVSLAMMILMLAMALDGVVLARKVTRLVDARFPENTESRWKLGLYAAGRASQLRRTRSPRPQVHRGERVS